MIATSTNQTPRVVYTVPPVEQMRTSSRSDPEYLPRVNFLYATDFHSNQTTTCFRYKLRSFDLYDGVPPHLFTPDTQWKKITGPWDYSTDLTADRHTYDEQGYQQFLEAAKCRSFSNPRDLEAMIRLEYFVPLSFTSVKVEAEVQKINGKLSYRLVRRSDISSNILSDSVVMMNANLFDSYDEAMDHARGVIAERKHELFMLHLCDVENDVAEMLGRLPASNRDEAALVLRSIHYPMGYALRYDNGRILLRDSKPCSWRTVYSI